MRILVLILILYPAILFSQITSFPWNEDFESGALPSGWTQEFVNDSVDWQFVSGSVFGDPDSAYSGNYNASFGSADYDNKTTKLIIPALDISSLSSPVLSFYHIQKPFDTDQDELKIYYKIGASGTWMLLQSYTSAINTWTLHEINLPTEISELYIAFEGKSGYGWGICIDNVSIYDQIDCAEPSDFEVLYTTTVSSLINWLTGDSEDTWEIEYGLQDFTQGTGTTLMVNELPFSLEGLTSEQTYDIYIRSFCDPGYSSWIGPFSFTTTCSVINVFPYNQGFEMSTVPAPCWNIIYANPSPPAGNLILHSTEYAYEGNRALKFSSANVGAPYNQYLISPEFSFSESMNFNFRYKKKATGIEIFTIGISTSGNNLSDFTWDSDIYVTDNNCNYFHRDITSDVKYIAIQYKSILQNSLFIDALNIKPAESCYAPIDILTSNITYNSVDVEWTALNGESNWIVEYGPSDFILGSGTQVSVTSSSTTISELNYSTDYDLYVYADCGINGLSNESDKVSFTTLPACYPVANFVVSDQTNDEIILSWASSPETTYEVEYGIAGFILGTGTVISGINAGTVNITGLSANTIYDFYIRAFCDQTMAYSDYVGPITAKTHLCADGCYYTFKLNDYWGDGWGNVSIKVVQNSQITDVLSFSNGYNHDFPVFICNGTNVEIILNQNAFSDECGFEIYSNYNVLIYKQNQETLGSLPDQSLLCSFSGSCEEPSCYPPINLSYENLSYSDVDVVWEIGNDENYWILEYGYSGFTPATGSFVYDIPENNYHLESLTPGQEYDVYVYSDCESNGLSIAAGPLTFTCYEAPFALDFCGLNIDIPDNSFKFVNFETSGISPSSAYTEVIFKSVELIIEHPYDADIDLFLTSPEGTTIELFSDVGGEGDNFGDSGGSCSFKTELSIYPQDGSITAGVAPFNGSYQAEGDLNEFNNGENFNGLWRLKIFDDATFYTGKFQYFNINFVETSAITFSGNTFYESLSNDGSIENSISAKLYNLSFLNTGFLTQDVDFTINNLPDGLNCEVEVVSADSAVISLTGSAINHVYNVNNIVFTFENAAFNTQYPDLISGKSKTFSIIFNADTDIVLDNMPADTICLGEQNIAVPYSITNIGEIEILSGSEIALSVEYPVGTEIFNEIISLSEALNVGQTITGVTSNTLNFDIAGIHAVRLIANLPGESITYNNSIDEIFYVSTYDIVFPQAINDTILTDQFPYNINVQADFTPLECEETLYYEWNGNVGTNSYNVGNIGWVYLFTSSTYCNRLDSVYVDIIDILNSSNTSNITLYPNPAKDYVFIMSDDFIEEININNINGQNIGIFKVNGNNYYLDLKAWMPGIYFIQVFDKSNNFEMLRLIKLY